MLAAVFNGIKKITLKKLLIKQIYLNDMSNIFSDENISGSIKVPLNNK